MCSSPVLLLCVLWFLQYLCCVLFDWILWFMWWKLTMSSYSVSSWEYIYDSECVELHAMLVRSRVAEPENCSQITRWRTGDDFKQWNHAVSVDNSDEMWLKHLINHFPQRNCPPWSSYPNRSVVSDDSCNGYIYVMCLLSIKKMKRAWSDLWW